MDLTTPSAASASASASATQPSQPYLSPDNNAHSKLSHHSPVHDDDANAWSDGDDVSSPDDGVKGPNGAVKRKRPLSVSCETCKQRKVKCDRGQPACGWCLKNNQACTYLPRKKPGLRAGYGRELEARLDKLETLLHQQQLQISHLSNNQTQQLSPHDAPVFRNPSVIQTPHVPRPETALFLQKPSSFHSQSPIQPDFGAGLPGTRQAPPPAPGNGYQAGISSDEAHHSLNNLGAARDVYGPVHHSPFPSLSGQHPHANLGQQDNDFPPYDLLYCLVDLWFKHIYPWCPILHRQTTLNSLFGDHGLDEADRILLHAIVATTLRFSSDQRLTPDKREHYHRTSKQKVLLHGMENSTVKSLQALVILSLDVVGCSNGPPGRNMLALMSQSVVQLGLSTEASSPMVAPQYASIYTLRAIVLSEPKDWIEEESRRRLLWMIYVLDRYATVATAFEFALDENEIDRQLPCRDELFNRNVPIETRWFPSPSRTDYSVNKPENLGSFSYFVEILGILSRIHKFLKKKVDITSISDVQEWQSEYRQLDSAIEQWKYNLPSEYGNSARVFAGNGGMNKSLTSGMVMLHAAFHTTVIRLHSSAAYPTHRSPIFNASFSAGQKCLTAVENITALCACVRDNNLLTKLGPQFAFSLWVAARVLLVHGSTIDHRVDPSIHLLVSTLQEMGQYWEVGTRYANLLSRVLHEYQESQRAPAGANGERVTPSTVKILADMRRCAFDLDFLITRLPKHLPATKGTVTPARTPGPNELEYLDVFDFFNMPRLPASIDGPMSYGSHAPNAGGDAIHIPDARQTGAGAAAGPAAGAGGVPSNEFNITNYMVDASSDWFMKNGS